MRTPGCSWRAAPTRCSDDSRRRWPKRRVGERFEEAASLRDQLRALERLETPQKITTTEIEERDLFGACVEGGRAALQVFSVRDGKVVAREGYLLGGVAEPETVLASAIQQFYAQGRYVPREVLVRRRDSRPGADRSLALGAARHQRAHPRAAAGREGAAAGAGREATRGSPSTSSGSTRASSRRRSCARCATCSTSRWSRAASSASTSRTSRARTSWPRWSASRTACRRSRTTASSASRRWRARPTTSPRCARWWAAATSGCSRKARTCRTSC